MARKHYGTNCNQNKGWKEQNYSFRLSPSGEEQLPPAHAESEILCFNDHIPVGNGSEALSMVIRVPVLLHLLMPYEHHCARI